MDKLDEALRKFKAAKKALEDLSPNEYSVITLQSILHHDGTRELECKVYISSLNWHSGDTWEKALKSIKERKDA